MKIKALFAGLLLACVAHAQITLSITSVTPSCANPCNGSVTASASGGVPPYTYAISPTSATSLTGTFNNLCAGTYTVGVADANSAFATTTVTIGTISAPAITGVVTSPVNPPFNYQAQVSYTGGQPPYYIYWVAMPSQSQIRIDTVMSMSDTITHLTPGDYGVLINDSLNAAAGCIPAVTSPYPFSICDQSIGGGIISVTPNDTVCPGDQVTVTYSALLFGPVNIIAQVFYSDNPNCDPSSSNGTFTCAPTQTTTFYGSWMYATGCAPIQYTPLTVTVIPCTTGMQEAQGEDGISLFPNPGNGSFTVKGNSPDAMTVTIFDQSGRSCFSAVAHSGDEIHAGLSAGIYFCTITSGDKTTTQKLVITGK
ncbi:MAG TPA: T9SS type A sorting domain-containing protein [Bacteroidia bacterium]|nr:T9SS type A sorting domain-containing protein [Bacteroidia bacterium]